MSDEGAKTTTLSFFSSLLGGALGGAGMNPFAQSLFPQGLGAGQANAVQQLGAQQAQASAEYLKMLQQLQAGISQKPPEQEKKKEPVKEPQKVNLFPKRAIQLEEK